MKNINLKGGGYFCSFSTQLYTLTLIQLTKEERVTFDKASFITILIQLKRLEFSGSKRFLIKNHR